MSGGVYALVGSGLAILAAALTALVVVINQRLGDLAGRMSGLESSLDSRMSGLKSSVDSRIGDVSADLRGLRGELRDDLSGLGGELRAELRGLREELRADRERADRRHEEIMARLTVVEGARS